MYCINTIFLRIRSVLKTTVFVMPVAFLLFTILMALEIRLNPPKVFYTKEGDNAIFIDLTTRASLLSGDDLDNLYYDIPITVTYYIEFYEDRLFLDNQLINIALVRKVYYDQWSKDFFVEEGDGKLTRYRNLTQLRNNIINLKGVRLIDKNNIAPEKQYYFKTRIAIKIKNFTLYYYLINNLISIFKYKTTYYFSAMYTGKDILELAQPIQ